MCRDFTKTALAKERVLIGRLCTAVNAFYEKPENMEAYVKWKKDKETENDENYDYDGYS